ncbi:hypothetical protein [Dinoroseobacter sp. S76]|uniref:hypothetical protein n=1 Tax=Dinoroseobacter sp. S76 TaxID=3415124 RepID=UPI003C7D4CF5
MPDLVYVDGETIRSIAVKYVGMEIGRTSGREISGSWNFLIQGEVSGAETNSVMRDIRAMLPEDIVLAVVPNLPSEVVFSSVGEAVEAFAQSGENRLVSGAAVRLRGRIVVPNHDETLEFDPFAPPKLELPVVTFHDEQCFVVRVEGDDYRLPVYVPEAAKSQLVFCHDNPVDLLGIVKWSPGYSPRGGRSLNLAVRAVALWLR